MLLSSSSNLISGLWLAPMLGLAMVIVPATVRADPITIRVVNGKNGHPITDEKLQLWFNRESIGAMSISTDKQGVAHLDAPSDASLLVYANLYVDCRYSKQTGPERLAYPVSDIVRLGVLAANTCGKLKRSPIPGELIFFVRPEHWWEGMRR